MADTVGRSLKTRPQVHSGLEHGWSVNVNLGYGTMTNCFGTAVLNRKRYVGVEKHGSKLEVMVPVENIFPLALNRAHHF